MMTEGLKPCPFCGEEAFTGETLDQTGENRYVACHKSTCAFLGYFTAEAEAVEAWNTRTDPRDAEIAELVEALGYRERAAKAVELLKLLAAEHPAAVSADDPRLEPFCDDYLPTDTFNALCNIGWIDQIGSGDFDDYRAILLPQGIAALTKHKEINP